jgi:hypothetical protein
MAFLRPCFSTKVYKYEAGVKTSVRVCSVKAAGGQAVNYKLIRTCLTNINIIMKLIIFSFPPHYKISQYCKQFALKNLPDVTEVVYIWDDFSADNETLLEQLRDKNKVILFSDFKNVSKEPNGWLRQQFVKLQLHQYFDDDHYLILDGDTIIRNRYVFDNQKPTVFMSKEYYKPYFYFIKKCLGLRKNNNFSFVTPLFYFEKDVLKSLEEFSIKKNKCDVVEFYLQNKWKDYNPTPPFSEFEIYGTFATQVLNKQYNLREADFRFTSNLSKDLKSTNKNLMLIGRDDSVSDNDWKYLSYYEKQ